LAAPNFATWIPQIRAAGLVPGAYHWIRRGSGAQQAQFFYNLVRQVGGPEGMLIQLDCEDDATYADIVAWRDEWRRLSGGHPFLLYTGGWWWDVAGRRWDGAAVTPYLWQSHYLSADADTFPDDPAAFAARIPTAWWTPGYGGWSTATFLQYSSQADAGGLGNNVDVNAFRGTREQLLALTHAPGRAPTVEVPDMTPEQSAHFDAAVWRIEAIFNNREAVIGGPHKDKPEGVNQLHAALVAIAEPEVGVLTGADLQAVQTAAQAGAHSALDGATATIRAAQ
jgi:hypothetical protein